jgi:hypothetical protein
MYRAFVGYEIDDLGNTIWKESKDFVSKEEAQQWINNMLDNKNYDTGGIKYTLDKDEEQMINEFEAQEEARLEIGIPKNVL